MSQEHGRPNNISNTEAYNVLVNFFFLQLNIYSESNLKAVCERYGTCAGGDDERCTAFVFIHCVEVDGVSSARLKT